MRSFVSLKKYHRLIANSNLKSWNFDVSLNLLRINDIRRDKRNYIKKVEEYQIYDGR